jgi:hypothetical protein
MTCDSQFHSNTHPEDDLMKQHLKPLVLPMLILIGCLFVAPMTVVQAQDGHEGHDHAHGTRDVQQGEGPYSIEFKTHPAPSEIVPDGERVELMFNVTHGHEPARDVTLSYRIHAPEERFWFGTEFPAVEGSTLLDGSVPLVNGQQTMTMILPIRGEYQVKATARGPEGTTHTTTSFSVPANPDEIMNLSIFLIALFFVGGFAGAVFAWANPKNTPASLIAGAMVLPILAGLVSPDEVLAHGQGDWDPHVLEQNTGVDTMREDVQLSTKVFPQPARVGEILKVSHTVRTETTRADGDEAPEYRAESHFVHSAGGLEMVTQNLWLEGTRGTFGVQLFDGAPHYLVTRFYRRTESYAPPEKPHSHGRTTAEAHGHDESGEAESHDHGTEENAHGDHGSEGHHGDTPFPWESELEVELDAGQYTVRFQDSGNPAMKWLLLPATTRDIRETARHAMEQCQSVDAGKSVSGDNRCYNLTLQPDGTTFTLNVDNPGTYRLFTQHLPREFDMVLENSEGEPVEPDRQFVTGKGEYLGKVVKQVAVTPVQPPFDDIIKSLLTLLAVTGLGVLAGYKLPRWMG